MFFCVCHCAHRGADCQNRGAESHGRNDAEMAVRKVDKQRRTYYEFYTDKEWGAAESYNLTVDSSQFGIEGTAQMLEEIVRQFMAGCWKP